MKPLTDKELLGLAANARLTTQGLKAAYHTRLKATHPDIVRNQGGDVKAATERTQRILEAFQRLEAQLQAKTERPPNQAADDFENPGALFRTVSKETLAHQRLVADLLNHPDKSPPQFARLLSRFYQRHPETIQPTASLLFKALEGATASSQVRGLVHTVIALTRSGKASLPPNPTQGLTDPALIALLTDTPSGPPTRRPFVPQEFTIP